MLFFLLQRFFEHNEVLSLYEFKLSVKQTKRQARQVGTALIF